MCPPTARGRAARRRPARGEPFRPKDCCRCSAGRRQQAVQGRLPGCSLHRGPDSRIGMHPGQAASRAGRIARAPCTRQIRAMAYRTIVSGGRRGGATRRCASTAQITAAPSTAVASGSAAGRGCAPAACRRAVHQGDTSPQVDALVRRGRWGRSLRRNGPTHRPETTLNALYSTGGLRGCPEAKSPG